MNGTELSIRRAHVVGVLVANAILWTAVVVVTGNPLLGGTAAVGLISIGSLLRKHSGAA